MTARLSVVFNTRNEQDHLPHALATVRGADEVVVADMASTDGTVAIAEAAGARVLDLEPAGYVEPGRQAAIDAATGDWVLVLDADERLGGGLLAVRSLIDAAPSDVGAFNLPFRVFLGPTRVRESGWGPRYERHVRLFRRGAVSWPTTIHAVPEVRGRTAMLAADGPVWVEHLNFRDLSHALEKFNAYTSVEAQHLRESDSLVSPARGTRAGIEEFLRRYSPDEDGSLSWALSWAMLGYRLFSQAKALEAMGWPAGAPSTAATTAAWEAFWSTLATTSLREGRQRALELAAGGDLLGADEQIVRLLHDWGDDAGVWSDLGAVRWALGQADQARAACLRALEIDPGCEDARHNLAEIGAGVDALIGG